MEDENPHADLDILPLNLRRMIARQPEVQEREQRLHRQHLQQPFTLPYTYRGLAEWMAELARRRQRRQERRQRRMQRKGLAHRYSFTKVLSH